MMKLKRFVILTVIGAVILINGQTLQNFESTCFTSANASGLCVPLRNCTSLFDQVLKGQTFGSTERTYLSISQCGYHDNQPLVCCPDLSLVPLDDNKFVKRGVCGTRYPRVSILYIKSYSGDFPWMALLEYSKRNISQGVHGTGVFINNRYILTAAHCVVGKGLPNSWSLTSVRLGEHNILEEPECDLDQPLDCISSVVNVPISEKIIHELYDKRSKNQANDIALLRLQYDVTYTDMIQPICLPFTHDLRTFNYDEASVQVIGWNRGTSEYSEKLNGHVALLNATKCENEFKRDGISIQDTQLCGTSKWGFDTCLGLSGSPIMSRYVPGKYYYLVGITSFSPIHCYQVERVDVYTKIGPYVDWIESKMVQV